MIIIQIHLNDAIFKNPGTIRNDTHS